MSFSNYKNYLFRLYCVIKLPMVLFYCLKRIKIASKKGYIEMADIYLLVTQYSVLGRSIIHYCYYEKKIILRQFSKLPGAIPDGNLFQSIYRFQANGMQRSFLICLAISAEINLKRLFKIFGSLHPLTLFTETVFI